jgi:hypothetical protein
MNFHGSQAAADEESPFGMLGMPAEMKQSIYLSAFLATNP